MQSTRRQFAATLPAALAALGGCLDGLFEPAPPDVVVFNDTTSPIGSDVVVEPVDGGDALVDDAPVIDAMGAVEYPNVLPSEGRFRFGVDVGDGRTGAETFVVESESGSLQAIVDESEVEFRKR